MKGIKRLLSLLLFAVTLLVAVTPALAVTKYEDAMARTMNEALIETGMAAKKAASVTQQYSFFGLLMIKDVQEQLMESKQSKVMSQAEAVGTSLGMALGNAYRSYGDKKMLETPAVMMLAARAGIAPIMAAETFAALSQNGYSFEAAVQIMHEASESVRAARYPDSGAQVCKLIRQRATEGWTMQKLQANIRQMTKTEKARQQDMIARMEQERKNQSKGSEGADRLAGNSRERQGTTSRTSGGTSAGRASARSEGVGASAAASSAAADNSSGQAGQADSSGQADSASSGSNDSSTDGSGNAAGGDSAGDSGGASGSDSGGGESDGDGSGDGSDDGGSDADGDGDDKGGSASEGSASESSD